jgi:2-dehydro-3-deoxygluconokinase
MIETAVKEFPNFKVAATTLRHVITATVNDWSAILWHDGKFHESRKYPEPRDPRPRRRRRLVRLGPPVRLSSKNDAQKAVEYGAAHGAFASTTPGDTSMATRKEVEKLMKGGGARVVR